jgi:hypothetical protein
MCSNRSKGESFQESFYGRVIREVSKYGIKMPVIGRKGSADGTESDSVLWSKNSNGEVFRDRRGGDRQCRISPKCALR